MDSVRSRRRLQLRPCSDHVRPWSVPTSLLWCSRRLHCTATATLRCSYCAHVTTAKDGAHFVHAQSARPLMETYETLQCPTEMPRRCFCALGDPAIDCTLMACSRRVLGVFTACKALSVRAHFDVVCSDVSMDSVRSRRRLQMRPCGDHVRPCASLERAHVAPVAL